MIKQRYTVQRGILVNVVLIVLILMFAVISMNSGKMNLSPQEVLNVLLGNGTGKHNLILFDFSNATNRIVDLGRSGNGSGWGRDAEFAAQ
ncbi:hypothetical protein ACFSQ7_14570 [Paenibacillus rhizoplanae]